MKNRNILRGLGRLALVSAALLLPGCASYDEAYYYGEGGYYGDPYWGYGAWHVHDDDDHYHVGGGGGGGGDASRPGRPSHPIAPPDRGLRPAQLPARSIPAPAPRPSMGGGGRGGGGGRRR